MRKILWDFEIQTNYPISVRKTDLWLINMKKRTFHLVDFTILVDNRVKIKESESTDKYLDLARKLEKL